MEIQKKLQFYIKKDEKFNNYRKLVIDTAGKTPFFNELQKNIIEYEKIDLICDEKENLNISDYSNAQKDLSIVELSLGIYASSDNYRHLDFELQHQ